MYENGRKVSRYYKMREHKRRMKDRFLKNPYMYSAVGMEFEQYLASLDPFLRTYSYGARKDYMPACEQYWRHAYISGPRKYAKEATNSKIRAYWRDEFAHCDNWEDFDTNMQNANYQKYFDYNWTVY